MRASAGPVGAVLGLCAAASTACTYSPPELIDARVIPDATPPDARPLGIIDGICTGEPDGVRVLVYTYENLWRHQSNLTARLAIYDMCETRGFNVTTTNDPYSINATRLAETDVVVFAVTSGPGMDALGRADFQAWVEAGGGVVGIHSASATEQFWPWFLDMIGAKFWTHAPGMQQATVRIESQTHPITAGLASSFVHTDEWYIFERLPEEVPGIQPLLAVDEDTLPPDYPDENLIGYHVVGWAHERFGGRVFYTALCHNPQCFDEPIIEELIARAIEWAAHRR